MNRRFETFDGTRSNDKEDRNNNFRRKFSVIDEIKKKNISILILIWTKCMAHPSVRMNLKKFCVKTVLLI